MKKLFLLAVVVVLAALGWFGLARSRPLEFSHATATVVAAPAPKVVTPPPQTAPPAPAAPEAKPVSRVTVDSKSAALTPSARPAVEKMNLALMLDADGHYHDDVRGVSANLPEGWKIRDAQRWGDDLRQNTVWMTPNPPSTATPSMYYQSYPENKPDLSSTETYFRGLAEYKENSRNGGGKNDYKNVPESFEFTQINGNPAMTYFATFTRGNEVMTEHFIRVLGQNGYVMFFTSGKLEDVKTILPQLKAMAGSVKVP